MIAFACSVGEPEPYVRYAEPGIRLASEPDSERLVFATADTMSRSYNLLLERAAKLDDLEALVIVHPYAEIADPDLCRKARQALEDPDVAIVGSIGASGVRSIAWWEGAISSGEVIHRYIDYGGGDVPAFGWRSPTPAPAEVDVVDGFLMILSPWAVRNIRFDEEIVLPHGADVDFCLQVRAAGRKVVTADIKLIEHRSLDIVKDAELWIEAHIAFGRKWAGRLPTDGGDEASGWQERARRLEAEREAARAIAYSKKLGYDARIEALEQALREAHATFSWRVTTPLRVVNKWRRDRAGA